jgi:hypothetical protein
MKFTYDFIKENLKIYEEAKAKLPIITEFELGSVTYNAMRSIGLGEFAEFYNFKSVHSIINAISWRELKPILIECTNNVRFKTWLKNRTEVKFRQMLNNVDEFDRLLNGRWITKPNYNRRGRRSSERVEGLDFAFVPLINWVISNDIEICDLSGQHLLLNKIKWYKGVILNLDTVALREVEITTNMMSSLVDSISSSNIDFRKLNIDFIIDSLSNNIRSLMKVPLGTKLKSLIDLERSGVSYLTKDNYYTVDSSTISNGFIRVFITDNTGFRSYYDYKHFEDMQIHRDILLRQMGL